MAEAQQQYRQIAADPKAQRDESLAATLGLARLELAADPASALATLSTINSTAVPPDMAWEIDLLKARGGNMAAPDKAPDARAALDRAWAEASNASVADSAVATVAGDRALAAGGAGDRKTLIAMLAVDRSYRSANGGRSSIFSDLPLCGSGGITPQDAVMIDVAHWASAEGRPPLSSGQAVRGSRLYQLHNRTGDEQGAKAAIAHIEVPQTACDLFRSAAALCDVKHH